MAIKLENIKGEIICVRPIYTERGDATIIYLREEEMVIDRGIRSVVAALARSYAIDLGSQRKHLETRLQRRGVMPFYLAEDRVFVPLKMRKAVAPKDMVYGYLDVRYMGNMEQREDGSCIVALEAGRRLEILSKPGTVAHLYHLGKGLLEQLQAEKVGDAAEKMAVGVTIYYYKTLKGIERNLQELKDILAKKRE
jgi:hypothetical protein